MSITTSGAGAVAKGLDDFARILEAEARRAVEDAGQTLVRESARMTAAEDLIGATRRFAKGWTTENDHAPGVARSETYNRAPHQWFAQRGRGPGKMPPERPIKAWMRAKGIPEEALWPIRKSIGDLGTIRRFGARPGPAGPDVLHTVTEREAAGIFREMTRAYDRALARV